MINLKVPKDEDYGTKVLVGALLMWLALCSTIALIAVLLTYLFAYALQL